MNFRENFKKDMKKCDHHIADLRKQLASRYAAVEKVRPRMPGWEGPAGGEGGWEPAGAPCAKAEAFVPPVAGSGGVGSMRSPSPSQRVGGPLPPGAQILSGSGRGCTCSGGYGGPPSST